MERKVVTVWLKEQVRRLQATAAFARVISTHERSLAAAVRRFSRMRTDGVRYELALLISDGNGNVGDQAMLEAVCEKVEGGVLIIADSPGGVRRAHTLPSNCSIVVIPGVVTRWRPFAMSRVRALCSAIDSARNFGVIGADVMDGVYSPASSVLRSTYLKVAADAGVPARLFGFSWSGSATASASVSLRSAAARARVFPRDPRSEERLKAAGIVPLIPAADLVFTSKSTKMPENVLEETSGSFALINASGLIASRSEDYVQEYSKIVRAVIEATDLTPILVPHVHRRGDDDMAALREIYDYVADPGLVLIEDELSPAEVRWLTSRSRLIVTGRMHLAVMGLNMGAVAITLATVGKVEGLYDMFGQPELVVDSGPGYGDRVAGVVRLISGDLTGRAAVVSRSLPAIRSLSERNFDGLAVRPG